ncbi:MAG TPA: HAD family hydrolase [Candidatus Nanoarchaeia archaeon]|nr:HAD family hydrolase [Candidatus Nanoarchaeia archaeon]
MRLWLFDIDGTLVNITHVHLAAYKNLYRDFVHCDAPTDLILITFGMSEHDMHSFVFGKLGLKFDSGLVKKMLAAHPFYFQKELAAAEVVPLPHAVDFLDAIKRANEPLGVVTGNLPENARLILEKAGLSHYFDFVSTDDGGRERWQIVMHGLELARGRFDDVVVIGDTPFDIIAARRAALESGKKITVAVVSTGTSDYTELKAAKPDMHFSTLEDYREAFGLD